MKARKQRSNHYTYELQQKYLVSSKLTLTKSRTASRSLNRLSVLQLEHYKHPAVLVGSERKPWSELVEQVMPD